MKAKPIIRMLTDIGMTVVLLFLMAYALVGEAAHEWLGVAMFVLLVIHHVLNINWIKNIGKSKYTAFRMVQTVLVALVLLTMLGSMISGIILSKHVFDFLSINSGHAIARTVHMLCGYWGFIFMSLHLGLHWNMVVAMAGKISMFQKKTAIRISRVLAVFIAGYGAYALFKRQIGDYLFSRTMFAFFDYSESLWRFMLDYLAVMGLFVFAGYYVGVFLRKTNNPKDS